ncbi:MAG TPA: CDP-diacylglycerol--glycerol-3-phosphate 3-phosphatidyltransferase [Chthoniobacteraceae bacterium]|nr:CDP-diacylglycerol--glycerol-3-phosphate 3-phosphatidyltransferase [Chthoniobacteraceae bacterium]
MNLPNQLTVSRFFLTGGFVASMTLGWHGETNWLTTPLNWGWGFSFGLVLFVAAAVTDYFDGEIARRRKLVTDFGTLMDPVADKVLMAAAFICLIPEHAIPAWAAIVIISREFLITGLRLLAASKGLVLPAEKLGKHKTAWQMATVIYFLVLLSLAEMQRAGWFFIGVPWERAWHIGGPILIAIALVLTLYSGLGYLWRHRELIAAE